MNLTADYDLRAMPVTFDSCVFFANADAYRQCLGASGLDVEIIQNEYRLASERDKTFNKGQKDWRVYNVISKVPHLLPSVRSVKWSTREPVTLSTLIFPQSYNPLVRGKELNWIACYGLKFLDQFKGTNINLQPFTAPTCALDLVRSSLGEGFITITLRTSSFQPQRNSNLEVWSQVANLLRTEGNKVVILPDFEDFLGKKQYLKFFPEELVFAPALIDLSVRQAVYSLALHNFATSNGPAGMLYLSKAPFSLFKLIVPGIPTTSEKYLQDALGIRRGEKPFFCGARQHFIWSEDDLDSVTEHLSAVNLSPTLENC